jgi:hypothetical protein
MRRIISESSSVEFDVVTGPRPDQRLAQWRAVFDETRKSGVGAVIEDESGNRFLLVPCRFAPERSESAASYEDDDE